MLVIFGWERAERVISRKGPVEALLGELVLVGVGHTHGDVVVVLHATNLAPEEQFFEVFIGGFVEQLLKSHL